MEQLKREQEEVEQSMLKDIDAERENIKLQQDQLIDRFESEKRDLE